MSRVPLDIEELATLSEQERRHAKEIGDALSVPVCVCRSCMTLREKMAALMPEVVRLLRKLNNKSSRVFPVDVDATVKQGNEVIVKRSYDLGPCCKNCWHGPGLGCEERGNCSCHW